MIKNSLKNILSGSLWGVISKIIDSVTKFITIPLLITYYGKSDFGLIVLAFSLNTYLRLLDLGMNTGGVRYFSVWFSQNENDKIIRLSQSSVLIYGLIGIINAAVFLGIAYFADVLFSISPGQVEVFRVMMYMLAVSGVISWAGYVVEQLLTAIEEFSWLSRTRVVTSILTFLAVFLAIEYKLSIEVYFLIYTLSSLVLLPFNVFRLKRTHLPVLTLLNPKWHVKDFKEVFRYSLGLFAMGIFQVSSDTVRPVLLGMFAKNGIDILADYRIAHTIALFVLSIGAVFFSILLPVSSKTYAQDDTRKKELIIFQGTKLISAFMGLLVFGIMINANYLLEVYVGQEYSHLTLWINIWLITLLISMHTYPVSSLIFSGGNTKPLVWSSAIGCIFSIVITVVLVPYLNIGAAVIGYLAFVIINNVYTYVYYIPVILKLNSVEIFFNCFLRVTIIAAVAAAIAMALDNLFTLDSVHLAMFVRSSLFVILFALGIYWFLIKEEELNSLKKLLQSNSILGLIK